MRKGVLVCLVLIVFLIMLMNFSSSAPCTEVCIDSDGGVYPYIKGSTFGYDSYGGTGTCMNYTDKCDGLNRIMEFKCSYQNDPTGGNGYVSMSNIPCDYGCQDGACLSNSTCTSGADTNQNSIVDISELLNYIAEWKAGNVTIGDLLTAIGEWKNGC